MWNDWILKATAHQNNTMITLSPSMTAHSNAFTAEELAEIKTLPHLEGPDYDDKTITLKSGRRIRQWMWARKNERVDRVALI